MRLIMLIKIMPPGECSVTDYYYRFDKVLYSRDLTTIDLTKSYIHATYHKSRHYLTLMNEYYAVYCNRPSVAFMLQNNLFAHFAK